MCFCLWQSSMHLIDIFKALSVLLCAFGSSNNSTLQRILENIPFLFQCFLSMLYCLNRTCCGQSHNYVWHQYEFLMISRFRVWWVSAGVYYEIEIISELGCPVHMYQCMCSNAGARGQSVQNTV